MTLDSPGEEGLKPTRWLGFCSRKMQELIAGVEKIVFDLEADVEQQKGTGLLPFLGMDSGLCPFRHLSGEKTVVCKHWLRGLCKKGDQCEFLHQYDVTKMPECYFFSNFGKCSNKECPFLHVDPASRLRDCPWYNQGFCKNGPLCKYQHTRRVMCINYLVGFCPAGPKCKFMHPKMNLLLGNQDNFKSQAPGPAPLTSAGSISSKDSSVDRLPPSRISALHFLHYHLRTRHNMAQPSPSFKPLPQITCFRTSDLSQTLTPLASRRVRAIQLEKGADLEAAS
ncbi:putative cleavage and polyadenylation specificity factor subunit 4-like protein isoform X3 [Ornithorhynchus anatinus]|uniref:putative cleavage and polyadenylation specificity factor subunit 4-like protein isoform X3 n=1 Tax=Ornithorhynchus anatinus TaxID=9258 RepID=UPI0019D4D815|nr:putative cleavage and polyadenylation specificity factor subunit 4-like protein isoform X3 [Ornithorhynchus anatinus]